MHWNKSDQISVKNNPNGANTLKKSNSQHNINFMYNRNAYDYGDKEQNDFKKVPLKDLFKIPQQELKINEHEINNVKTKNIELNKN